MNESAPEAHKVAPTVVGIGASAGGLAALKTFFAGIPEDSGLAFVVVVHLAPERESHLADLLQPYCKLPVQQVTETVPLEVDRVYVIPPNANLDAIDSHLRLSNLEEKRRERAPIDHFFRTLANTHDGHSMGVVLTGTGGDGALGIREIKQKQGFAIVQDPNEAEYDGMPQSAIATGLVDLVLPVAEIPAAVLRVAHTAPKLRIVSDADDGDNDVKQLLQHIFVQIRAHTGRDFNRYKPSTILRRIARRMQLNQVEALPAYLALLRSNSEEVRRLADDLLVTVTSFFRDPEVFQYLEESVVPALFEGKGPGDDIRVWSVGCATGEEAYSIAMLMIEESARRESGYHIQIFASDLHEHSLDRARQGFFPGEIETDVPESRLERFFTKQPGGYRIRKEVRESVVFAPHNLLGDPPFSRIDLVLCRNVLIYLQRPVQRDVFDLFHYALRPEGYLVLGTSETIDGAEYFAVQDKKRGIYIRKNVRGAEPRLPVFPFSRLTPADAPTPATSHLPEPVLPSAFHLKMLEQYAPPSILLGADDKILHLSEHASRYLLHPGGDMTSRGPQSVREELRVELRSLLHEAREHQRALRSTPILVRFNGESHPVVLDVRPSPDPTRKDFVLVVFHESSTEADSAKQGEMPSSDQELADELDLTRRRLQTIIEQYETAQEEMRAANEELQSANEELRSTMEELETSKEELQSVNEELQTVNQENRHKVEELALLSADLQNLLFSTDIATLFLDRELRILRFTPKVSDLFNVRATDRGRPISDLTHRLENVDLLADATAVLQHLAPIEREIKDANGRWYLARVLPYRSLEDQIGGVVVTMVDITQRKLGEEALRASEERTAGELSAMARLHELVTQLLTAPDLRSALDEVLHASMAITEAQMGNVLLWNAQSGKLELASSRGFSRAQLDCFRAIGLNENYVAAQAARTGRRAIVEDIEADPRFVSSPPITSGAAYRGVQSTPILSRDGSLFGVLSTHYREPNQPSDRELRILDLYARQAADFIEHIRAQESLLAKTAALVQEDSRKDRFLATLGHELRNPLAALQSALQALELGLRPESEVRTMMSNHVVQLRHLVDDLLDLSRINRGKVTLHKSRCDMRTLVTQASQAVEGDIAAKKQSLEVSATPEFSLIADGTRVIQIITNVLGNASKYTPEGGHIKVSAVQKDDHAIIEISDDGHGLAPEQLSTVFEAFHQGVTDGVGLGIGLALVRDLVALHDGAIRAESAGVGKGSRFTIELPIGNVEGSTDPGEPSGENGNRFARSTRLLVIDDLQDAADSLAMVLRHRGAEVATAYTGAAGLRMVSSWKPDIVLLDIALPDMTGFEVATQIRARSGSNGVVLIAVTGFGDARTLEKIDEAGFDDRMLKPVDPDQLHQMIARLLLR